MSKLATLIEKAAKCRTRADHLKAREYITAELDRMYFEVLLAENGRCWSKAAKVSGMDRANLKRAARRVGVRGGLD